MDHEGLHWDTALPPSWWQLRGWEEGDGWDEGFALVQAVGPQEQGHAGVTCLGPRTNRQPPAPGVPGGQSGKEQ